MRREEEREILRQLRQALRKDGCVCGPEISVDVHAKRAQIAHDHWCPLWRVLLEGPPQEPPPDE